MLSIDTNVLVRVLVDDAEAKQQCILARQTVAGKLVNDYQPIKISPNPPLQKKG